MKPIVIFVIVLNLMGLAVFSGLSMAAEGEKAGFKAEQEKVVMEWRKERDAFFKTHQRSPLTTQEKKVFKGLKYYKFDPNYAFSGEIKRFVLHINNPDYYATFLTNKGTNKRYIRYGKFLFQLNGKEYTLQVYKSMLSDILFIPFKDKTNGKETYDGGRYIDAEVLTGYKMVLDFNMAYHPSCAYNEKFICVLPPRENILEIPIPAGEKNYK
ncbi:MAG: DUF1684 domain-containing protein [Deltaproteobacteria bacterium]|nr:DUF1684 domain-containing protein [Deltaproteobacteria bacterium]